MLLSSVGLTEDPEFSGLMQAGPIGFDGDTSAFFGDEDGPLGDATPTGTSYLLYEHWGGTWLDAEKTPSNTEDDLMCWAAAASNVLAWTGWGAVSGMTTSDDIFAYFQDHWTDQGGLMRYGWDWWFDGTNPSQGWDGWSQVDVPGGGFYPAENFNDYFYRTDLDSAALSAIDNYLRSGYGVSIGIYGPGGHAITVWGFNYNPSDPSDYYGIWVTDSDDSKFTDSPPDRLRYYEVEYSGGKWYLQNYYGSNSWYIGTVQALARKPGSTPPDPPDPPPDPGPDPLTIQGTVFLDANENGTQDVGENGLANQRVFVDSNNNGVWDHDYVATVANNTQLPITDFSTTTSTITLANLPEVITDVNVTLHLTHTWDSDLTAYLVSPSGTRVQLFSGVGSSGDNFWGTVLDDEASVSISSGSAPFAGSFRPEEQLSAFDGENPNGVWSLEIYDGYGADQGTLYRWSLTITTEELSAQTDSQGDYQITDLEAGNYRIGLVCPDGYLQTVPAEGFYSVTLSGDTPASDAYDFGVAAPSATNLGTVDQQQLTGLSPNGDVLWYRFQTSRQALLTLTAQAANQSATLALYDSNLSLLSSTGDPATDLRIDWVAGEGEVFYVRLGGNSTDVDLAVTNLVGLSGRMLTVAGTAGDDSFWLSAGSCVQFEINGVAYAYCGNQFAGVAFDGGAGTDTATVSGSLRDDTLVMRPATATLTSEAYQTGDDYLVSTPTYAELSGTGFFLRVEQFDVVGVFCRAGGDDTADVYDSAGDDTFTAYPTVAAMQGSGYFNGYVGFDTLRAHATGGGNDRANLYDSSGDDYLDDTFTAYPTVAAMQGSGYFNGYVGFDTVRAHATGGGNDRANLFDSAGDDYLVSSPSYSQLSGAGYLLRAEQFDVVGVFCKAGGDDTADIYDSAGDDVLTAYGRLAALQGSGYFNGYVDYRVLVVDYSWVEAVSSRGGHDTKHVEAIDYVLQTTGPWVAV